MAIELDKTPLFSSMRRGVLLFLAHLHLAICEAGRYRNSKQGADYKSIKS